TTMKQNGTVVPTQLQALFANARPWRYTVPVGENSPQRACQPGPAPYQGGSALDLVGAWIALSSHIVCVFLANGSHIRRTFLADALHIPLTFPAHHLHEIAVAPYVRCKAKSSTHSAGSRLGDDARLAIYQMAR